MRDILLTLIVFGSIPFIFYRPYIGVLVWTWLSYMTPYRFTWSFAYDFRFAFVIALVTIVAWILSREPKRFSSRSVIVLVLAFWFWTTVTTILAIYKGPAQSEWLELTKTIIIDVVVTYSVISSRFRLNALVWVIVISLAFFGVKGGIFTLLTGGHYRVSGAPMSQFGENNFLALAMLTVIPLVRYLQLDSPQRYVRWLLGGAMFLCVISVLGSQSRGAFIGLLVLGGLIFLKSQRKILVSLGLVFTLGFGITFMPQSWHDRMSTILTYEKDASVQGRLDAWDHAIDLIQQRPLMGGGFEAFRGNKLSASGSYQSAHSIYFQVLGEHGIIGLALYLLLGGSAYFLAGSVRRRCEAHEELEWGKNLSRMIQTSLVVFACSGAFLSFAYFELLFHLVAITVIVKSLVEEALSNQYMQAKVPSRQPGPLVGDMLGTQSPQSREQDSA